MDSKTSSKKVIKALCQIVFWNLNKKKLKPLVSKLASATQATVLILTECLVDIQETLKDLKHQVSNSFFVPQSMSDEKFHCFCRDPTFDLSEIHKGDRWSFRKLELPSGPAILGIVHGIDIRNNDSAYRQQFAHLLATEIEMLKSNHDTNRFILIGDFNMNPFDPGMYLPAYMNAMMTKTCVRRAYRTYQRKRYDLYYNPMWSLFGDKSPGPPGTIYDSSNQGHYGWNMLDQVILSHSLVDQFDRVEIITEAGSDSLADKNGRPDSTRASDHFPISVLLKDQCHD